MPVIHGSHICQSSMKVICASHPCQSSVPWYLGSGIILFQAIHLFVCLKNAIFALLFHCISRKYTVLLENIYILFTLIKSKFYDCLFWLTIFYYVNYIPSFSRKVAWNLPARMMNYFNFWLKGKENGKFTETPCMFWTFLANFYCDKPVPLKRVNMIFFMSRRLYSNHLMCVINCFTLSHFKS